MDFTIHTKWYSPRKKASDSKYFLPFNIFDSIQLCRIAYGEKHGKIMPQFVSERMQTGILISSGWVRLVLYSLQETYLKPFCKINYSILVNNGASDNPCSETYAGPYAFSEVETRALSDFLQPIGRQINIYLSFHSYGQYILFPYGHTRDEVTEYHGIMVGSAIKC